MSNKESVKFYDGFVLKEEFEVPASKVDGLESYAKAFLGSTGRQERVELHSHGKIVRVEYPGDHGDDDIKTVHSQTYKGVGFATRRRLPAVREFIWEDVHVYSESCDLSKTTLVLQLEDGRGLMEVNRDKNKKTLGTTKYYWEGPDELRYIFEYDRHGHLDSVYDLTHDDTLSFEVIKDGLPDPQFFERGETLPKEISHTVLPG